MMLECRLTQYPIFVIDGGRQHAGAAGVSESGAMDRGALRQANQLLQQASLTAGLEVMGECEFVAHCAITLTVTGGLAPITLKSSNLPDQLINTGQVFELGANQTLMIGKVYQGMRMVIGLAGGVAVPLFFNSCCGIAREKFGGIGHGKPILSGDKCPIGTYQAVAKSHEMTIPFEKPTMNLEKPASMIDFVPNYQYSQFSVTSKYLFSSQVMRVSKQSDRMGLRIRCEQAIPSIIKHESQALALGVIQIPPDGQPIVMGPDRQTHGGYPVIGTVPEYAMNQLVQLTDNDAFYFSCVSIETAITKYWLSVR